MKACHFSPEAEADLVEIVTSIAADNPAAAQKLIGDIRSAYGKLAEMPALGHRRKDLTSDPEVLSFCVRNYYLVIYRKDTSPLQVARVLHGSRDVSAELKQN